MAKFKKRKAFRLSFWLIRIANAITNKRTVQAMVAALLYLLLRRT